MMTGRLLTIFEIPGIEAGAGASLAACGWSHCWPWNRHLVTRSHSPPGPTPDPPETVPENPLSVTVHYSPLSLQTSNILILWTKSSAYPAQCLGEEWKMHLRGSLFSPTVLKAWNVDSKGWNFSISCQVGLWVRPVCVYYRFKNPVVSF